jgi:hypothetical protein
MRRTPPVVVHLLPQPVVQGVVASLVLLAAAGLCAWACSHEPRAWPVWLAVLPATAWGWRAAAVARRRLRWDGEAWWLSAPARDDETMVRLAVLIDLDAWLLLRASPGPHWLPLSRGQQPQWGALRATLFSAAGGAVRQR